MPRNRRRKRRTNPATMLYVALALSVTIYVIVIPLILQSVVDEPIDEFGFRSASYSLGESIRDRAMTTFFVGWIFFFGAAIGSFLNVVAYRMPLGMSVVTSSSHCPFCTTPIESRDNVPVFGWLGLRGRCRACRLPISPRYPIVEAISGACFLWLAFTELLSAGANLPNGASDRLAGFAFVIFDPQWDLITLTLLHAMLSSMLLVWSLLEVDRARTASWFPVMGWFTVLAVAALSSWAHPVAWIAHRPDWLPAAHPVWARLETSLFGLAGGSLCGQLAASPQADARSRNRLTLALGMVGVVLGWQAVTLVAGAAVGASLVVRRLTPRPLLVPLVHAAVLIHIAAWRFVAPSSLPGMNWQPYVALLAFLAITQLIRYFATSASGTDAVSDHVVAGAAAVDDLGADAAGESNDEMVGDSAADS